MEEEEGVGERRKGKRKEVKKKGWKERSEEGETSSSESILHNMTHNVANRTQRDH